MLAKSSFGSVVIGQRVAFAWSHKNGPVPIHIQPLIQKAFMSDQVGDHFIIDLTVQVSGHGPATQLEQG